MRNLPPRAYHPGPRSPVSQSPHPPRILPAVLLAGVVGISTSGPLATLSSAAPLTIALWRLVLSLAAIGVALVVTGSWREWRTLRRRDVAVACGAGAMLALHFWSWIASLSLTSVAASVILVNLHPVVIVAGSALVLHERASRPQVVGLAVAMLGAAVVAFGDAGRGEAHLGASALLGDALAVLGAATVGLYYLAGRSLRQRLSLWPYVGLVYGACLLTVLLLAVVTGAPLLPPDRGDLWIFAGIALGPMLLGHTGFNWSLRYVPAYVVSLVILGEPVGATILAALLPGIAQQPGGWTLLGGGIVLGGLAVGTLAERR